MDKIIEQGIVGIVTGILTTVLIFLARNFWTTKIVPFLEKTRYQGVMLAGQWYGTSENTDEEQGEIFWNEATLFLDQNAHDLSGLFIFKFKNSEKDFVLDFNVRGYIWEGYVTLNFTPKDRRVTSYATALLKLHSGGCMLVGGWLFRNVNEEYVAHTALSLGRELESTANKLSNKDAEKLGASS